MPHCVYKMINSSKVIRKGRIKHLKSAQYLILSVYEETCLIDEDTKFDYCFNITYLNCKNILLEYCIIDHIHVLQRYMQGNRIQQDNLQYTLTIIISKYTKYM